MKKIKYEEIRAYIFSEELFQYGSVFSAKDKDGNYYLFTVTGHMFYKAKKRVIEYLDDSLIIGSRSANEIIRLIKLIIDIKELKWQ